MEYLFEFIFELIIGGSIEASKNNRVPKWIRYILIGIIALFFTVVIGTILLAGILSLQKNIFLGMFFLLLGIFMLIMSFVKFKKTYLIKTKGIGENK